MKPPPLIAWDVDDVLNHLTAEWFAEYRERHALPLRYEELTANPPDALLGLARADYLASLDDFRQRRYAALTPDPEVMAWFREYGGTCRHVAVTAAPLHFAPVSASWVMTHFGRWIRGFFLLPSPRPDDDFIRHEKTKGDILEQWQTVDVFVDDSEANLATAAHLPVRKVIFPAPWNRRRELPGAAALLEILKR